jgi:hypothetical protein
MCGEYFCTLFAASIGPHTDISSLQVSVYILNCSTTFRKFHKVQINFNVEYAMEAQRGRRGIVLLLLFNLGTWWVLVVKATPRPFYPSEWSGNHNMGGWRGPRASLDGCGKFRIRRDSIPEPSSP